MAPIVYQDIVKVQNKGLITIPKRFRDALGFEENSFARIRQEKGRLVVESVRTLPYLVRNYNQSDLEGFLKFDEEESKKLKSKGLI